MEANRPADRSDRDDMVLRGRIGAFCLQATHDPRATTARARALFFLASKSRSIRDGVLAPGERRRRAMAARRAYFARLAMRSAQARRHRPGSWPGRDLE